VHIFGKLLSLLRQGCALRLRLGANLAELSLILVALTLIVGALIDSFLSQILVSKRAKDFQLNEIKKITIKQIFSEVTADLDRHRYDLLPTIYREHRLLPNLRLGLGYFKINPLIYYKVKAVRNKSLQICGRFNSVPTNLVVKDWLVVNLRGFCKVSSSKGYSLTPDCFWLQVDKIFSANCATDFATLLHPIFKDYIIYSSDKALYFASFEGGTLVENQPIEENLSLLDLQISKLNSRTVTLNVLYKLNTVTNLTLVSSIPRLDLEELLFDPFL